MDAETLTLPSVSGEVAAAPWRPVSACPKGHPLPTLPTKWFDGIAWRDGREACRHCYEAGDEDWQTISKRGCSGT
jgi:hypothetical protein